MKNRRTCHGCQISFKPLPRGLGLYANYCSEACLRKGLFKVCECDNSLDNGEGRCVLCGKEIGVPA